MVAGFFKRAFSRQAPFPDVAPDQALFVIGDIHGRIDLLDKLLDKAPEGAQIICVGDYVDRGEESADVLRRLQSLPDVICLTGNHEEMMLGFIDAPERTGARWLRYGGLQTLASFRLRGISASTRSEDLIAARDQLVDAMGAPLIAWMRGLELMHQSGNVTIVHAGADPQRPLDYQDTAVLTWGHPDFLSKPRTDGQWVVHGHTIVDAPSAEQGRIAVDTGAYASGRLTAAHITADGVTFVTV